MEELDSIGPKILEKLAELGVIDDFFEAVDSDDTRSIIKLLRSVGTEDEIISEVLKKIEDGDL